MFSPRYKFVSPKEFTEEMLAAALDIDGQNFDKIDQGSNLCFEWKKKNYEIYFGIVDTMNENRLIGYINALPLSLDTIKMVFSKKVRDTDITPFLIQDYNEPEVKHLYLTSINIEESFHGTSVIRTLVKGFLEYLGSMAKERKIYFEGIYANAVTQQGILLAKRFNFKNVSFTRNAHCYRLSLIPFAVRNEGLSEDQLKEIYSKRSFSKVLSLTGDLNHSGLRD